MNLKAILSTISGLVFIFAFFPYSKAIVKKETSPRKATWLVWAAGDIIILIGMIAKGTISGLMVGAVIGATSIFLLSLKFGEPGWTKRDKICITLSALAITLWIYFGESNIGIALSLLALYIAAWPTYVSAWEKPENEDKRGWIFFNLANFFALVAIPHLTFADMAAPIVFTAIDLPMLFLLFIRPRLQKRAAEIVG